MNRLIRIIMDSGALFIFGIVIYLCYTILGEIIFITAILGWVWCKHLEDLFNLILRRKNEYKNM